MRGVVTAIWFAGVMAIGAVAGVELAHYRQSQLIEEARSASQAADKKPTPAAGPLPATATPVAKSAPAKPQMVQRAAESTAKKQGVARVAEVRPRTTAPVPPLEKPTPPPPVPPQPATAPVPTPTQTAEAPASASEEKAEAGVRIVISLPAQRAYVFKDGKLWDSSRVSTGKKGKRTPVGTYTILEKARYHRSNKYSNAPMPYMQRITWGGVALHAGHVPGYPASHGCIRLPRSFAKRLYAITNFSTVVVVTDKSIDSAKEAREGF